MLSRSATRNNRDVPELPDVDVLADGFTAALSGRALETMVVKQSLVVRATAAELHELRGRVFERAERRGKFLVLHLGPDRIVINAMLTGRAGLAAPGTRSWPSLAVSLLFGPRRDGSSEAGPAWTHGARWIPPQGSSVELRYRDPTRMGKVYVLPDGVERAVAGWEEQGPDADDPRLDLETWRLRIGRHTGELKSLLKNQSFVAGIGNGYSDEILWAARLAPFRKRSSLADEEVERLWRAAREVPIWAIGELRRRVPPRFEVEVRDFLRAHRRGGEACPRCGTTFSQVAPGGFVTTWCRTCQA
jgi:formamidopyrimidine-DNA glycosylase